jgi:signaling intermediate in Toll pathway protein
MKDLDFAIVALERMTVSVDSETKLEIFNTKDIILEQVVTDADSQKSFRDESTWVVSAISTKQKQLFSIHKSNVPIFVEGPYFTWVRSKMVEYYVMKTDPLPDVIEKIRRIDDYDRKLDDVRNMHNPFDNPFKKAMFECNMERPDVSVYELKEGIIYALCCTGSGSKNSLFRWTKFIESQHVKSLKSHPIIYRIKPKSKYLVEFDGLKEQEEQQQKQQETA